MRSNARPARSLPPTELSINALPPPSLQPYCSMEFVIQIDTKRRSSPAPPTSAENFRETIQRSRVKRRRNLRPRRSTTSRGDRPPALRHCAPLQLWWTIEQEICFFPDYGCCLLVKTVVSADQWAWDCFELAENL